MKDRLPQFTQKELLALWDLIELELEAQNTKYGRGRDYATLGRALKKVRAAYRANADG